MKKLVAFMLMLFCVTVRGDDPHRTLRVDLNRRGTPFSLEAWQGESVTYRVYLYQDGETWIPSTNSYGGLMGFGTNYADSSSMSLSTGQMTTATNYLDFSFTESKLNTNGIFYAQVMVTNSTGGKWVFNEGNWKINKSPITGSVDPLDLSYILNWDLYSFLGTPPYVSPTNSQTYTATNTASAAWYFNGGFYWYGTNFATLMASWVDQTVTNGILTAAKDYTDNATNGLGTAAWSNSTVFANAAQGSLADTALQPVSTQGLVTASITNAVLPLDGSQAMVGTLQMGAEKIFGGGNTIWLGGVANTLFYGTSFSPGTNVLYDLGTVSLYWRNVYAQNFYGNGANMTGVLYAAVANQATSLVGVVTADIMTNGANVSALANDAFYATTNQSDNMATKTYWANAVVDGTLNLNTNGLTNVTCIAIGTNNTGLGKIILPASTSTNDGIRFGDDVYMYRTAAANLGVLGAFHTYSGLRTPSIYSEGVDLAIGPAGADGKVLSINIGAVQSLLIHTNGAIKTVTLTATNNNGMSVGAGPNQLTLGQGGPVVITGTNFFFYNSATNWAGSWADYTGYYHGINSNGAIRVLTNAWGW